MVTSVAGVSHLSGGCIQQTFSHFAGADRHERTLR
jgi:hypothetical protein